jgi:hypothetical protein
MLLHWGPRPQNMTFWGTLHSQTITNPNPNKLFEPQKMESPGVLLSPPSEGGELERVLRDRKHLIEVIIQI